MTFFNKVKLICSTLTLALTDKGTRVQRERTKSWGRP